MRINKKGCKKTPDRKKAIKIKNTNVITINEFGIFVEKSYFYTIFLFLSLFATNKLRLSASQGSLWFKFSKT